MATYFRTTHSSQSSVWRLGRETPTKKLNLLLWSDLLARSILPAEGGYRTRSTPDPADDRTQSSTIRKSLPNKVDHHFRHGRAETRYTRAELKTVENVITTSSCTEKTGKSEPNLSTSHNGSDSSAGLFVFTVNNNVWNAARSWQPSTSTMLITKSLSLHVDNAVDQIQIRRKLFPRFIRYHKPLLSTRNTVGCKQSRTPPLPCA